MRTGRPARWPKINEMVIASGKAGVTHEELAHAAGVTVGALMQIIGRANKRHGTRLFSRRIRKGESRVFHADSLPAALPRDYVTGRTTAAVTMTDVIAYRASQLGPEGIDAAAMWAGMNKAQFSRAANPLRQAGKLFSYGYGEQSLRYFRTAEDAASYKAKRRIETGVVRATRIRKQRQAPKPHQALTIKKSAKPWKPPEKEHRPVIVPPGLKVQRLEGFTGDRWAVKTAPKIITAEDCRPWARYA